MLSAQLTMMIGLPGMASACCTAASGDTNSGNAASRSAIRIFCQFVGVTLSQGRIVVCGDDDA